jgi:5-methylcytosine-specific restriction endonuclease McrA
MSSIPHKCCSKCGADKPLAEFHKSAKRPDGYRSVCKACRKHESAGYYWCDPELQRAKMLERRKRNPDYMKRYSRDPARCAKCGELKTVNDFHANKNRRYGLNSYCKDCQGQYRANNIEGSKAYHKEHYKRNRNQYAIKARLWGIANRARRREIGKKWRKSNRLYGRVKHHEYRSRKIGNGGAFTANEWIDLCRECGNRCLACGSEVKLTADHIIPVSKGGSNDITNIQPLCGPCNSSKGNKTIDYRHD